MHPGRLEALTDEQRGWLQRAADDAAARSADLADSEARSIEIVCQSGARFAEASESDIAALEAAFVPVYAALEEHPETKVYVDQIQELRQSTPSAPSLSIPADCTGKAPHQATGGTGSAPAYVNGTYRYVLTQEDADEVGDLETGYPVINTITLKDGRLEGGCFGNQGGAYWVEGDRITFNSFEYDPDVAATFARDDQGNLHLNPVPPIDPGTAFQCFYKPWRKIG
jgi:hypothetical protein